MTESRLLDPAALRNRALALLQRLSSTRWTDHNTHDPGITLLEQFCFALTDLGYRTAFPVQDLLARGGDTLSPGVFTADQVLPSAPVTPGDLRKLLIDLPGVRNAWIEPVTDTAAWLDDDTGELLPVDPTRSPDLPTPGQLQPLGRYRVRLERFPDGDNALNNNQLASRAAQRLLSVRTLGEDLHEVTVMDRQWVALDATLEIAAGTDAAALLAAVHQALDEHISPAPCFHPLDELLRRGWRVDQIFEVPLLQQGFLDPQEFARLQRPDSLRLSDLIRVLMAVPGVLAVASLAFLDSSRKPTRDWVLPLNPQLTATYKPNDSRLRLHRRAVRVDNAAAHEAAATLRRAGRTAALAAAAPIQQPASALPAPAGRDRHLGRYHSLQLDLPRTYGVGPGGLASSEPTERRALAAQLKGYLMVFDQLLANQFAQLAQAGRMLSFDDRSEHIAWAQPISDDDGALQLDALRQQTGEAHAQWLQAITANASATAATGADTAALPHRHRLADHLLARLGEQWPDTLSNLDPAWPGPPSVSATGAGKAAAPRPPDAARSLRAKQAFLRNYPGFAMQRAGGPISLPDPGDSGAAVGGFARRLQHLLGLDPGSTARRWFIVEHLLLRPLPSDTAQEGPLMRGVASADPFSLQVSLVLPQPDEAAENPEAMRQGVEHVVHEAAPAHLAVRVLWLNTESLNSFAACHQRWWPLWCSHQAHRFGLPGPAFTEQALRSARNRMIDALGLADTYPLTDLSLVQMADKQVVAPVKGTITVAYGQTGSLGIVDAEHGMHYVLGEGDTPPPDEEQDPKSCQPGDDGLFRLQTPAITRDVRYRIWVRKLPRRDEQPLRPLRQLVDIKVGVDDALTLDLPDLPLLDTTLDNPRPDDTRLADFGAHARVRVRQSQIGVAYTVLLADQTPGAPVLGTGTDIELWTPALRVDTTVLVQASLVDPPNGVLATPMPLRARLHIAVKADPTLALRVAPTPLLELGATSGTLSIQSSQSGTSYQLYGRRVQPGEWVYAPAGTAGLVQADSYHPGVWAPRRPGPAQLPDGFRPVGTALQGLDGDLNLPLGAVNDNMVYLVQARRSHTPARGGGPLPSETGLNQAALVLVRPAAAPALQGVLLQAQSEGAPPGPLHLQLRQGQPGVYYHLRVQPDGPDLPQPAYMHQHDDLDPAVNQGLGRLGVELDLAVAMDPADLLAQADPGLASATPVDPALTPERRPPLPATVPLPPQVPATASLALRAAWARTGLDQVLPAPLNLLPLPTVAVERDDLAAPGVVALQVKVLSAADRHHIRRDDQALGAPQSGPEGSTLRLEAGRLVQDAVCTLVVTRDPAPDGLPLTRCLILPLRAAPRTALSCGLVANPVVVGQSAQVIVAASQPGVQYQLMASDGTVLGEPALGNDGDLVLNTGPLAGPIGGSVALRVQAQYVVRPYLPVWLDGEIAVQVWESAGTG